MIFLLRCTTCKTKRKIDMVHHAKNLDEAKAVWPEIKEHVTHYCQGEYEITELDASEKIDNRTDTKISV